MNSPVNYTETGVEELLPPYSGNVPGEAGCDHQGGYDHDDHQAGNGRAGYGPGAGYDPGSDGPEGYGDTMTHGRNGPVSGGRPWRRPGAADRLRRAGEPAGAGAGHAAEDIRFVVEEHTS